MRVGAPRAAAHRATCAPRRRRPRPDAPRVRRCSCTSPTGVDRIVTRTDLLTQVWESRIDPGSNVIDVHVSHLRDKFGDERWMIETVRGQGYRLRSRRDA